jgi:hypothetical protein
MTATATSTATPIRAIVRQGDVLLIPCDALPAGLDDAPITDHRGVVLAEGETSGHHHAVVGGHPKLFKFRDTRQTDRVLSLDDTGTVRVIGGGGGGVDRHTPITIAKGNYTVRIQRRWDATRVRRVAD